MTALTDCPDWYKLLPRHSY